MAATPPNELPFDGLLRREVVLLMLQTLSSMGFTATQELLEQESGVLLERDVVKTLHQAVLGADWEQAFAAMGRLEVGLDVKLALRFLLFEHKPPCIAYGRSSALPYSTRRPGSGFTRTAATSRARTQRIWRRCRVGPATGRGKPSGSG